MRFRGSPLFTLFVALGAILGAGPGDHVFAELEELLGDPLCDIVLGVGGAVLGGVLHEALAAVLGLG